MTQQRTLVDEALELIECLSVDERVQLFQRVPGMRSLALKDVIRFTYKAPRVRKLAMPRPARGTFDHPDDIV